MEALIGKGNKEIFNPAGLNVLSPRYAALQFVCPISAARESGVLIHCSSRSNTIDRQPLFSMHTHALRPLSTLTITIYQFIAIIC